MKTKKKIKKSIKKNLLNLTIQTSNSMFTIKSKIYT